LATWPLVEGAADKPIGGRGTTERWRWAAGERRSLAAQRRAIVS